MSANAPLPAEVDARPASTRFRWAIWGGAALVCVAIALIVAFVASSHSSSSSSSANYTTFAAGARPAPNFTLVDEHGKRFSLASLRGRPVIVTFIDPYCRDYCPREATILTQAATRLGSTPPAIVAVSTDPWANTQANFRADKLHWKLGPEWRWGTGSYGELAPVWKRYGVAVAVAKKTIAGVTIRRITHTLAAYLIDPVGNERALLLYPFTADDVVGAGKKVLAT
jgi:cytochrome oxidase Cu insertion factor (SCO1/SenC/PrrC family)